MIDSLGRILGKDSGCGGSVGRAIASHTRDPRFESSHRQDFIMNIFVEKTKIKKKRSGMAQFF